MFGVKCQKSLDAFEALSNITENMNNIECDEHIPYKVAILDNQMP